MRLRVIDGNLGKPQKQSSLISYVVNDGVALDAGGLGIMPLPCQKMLHSIFLSHSHADHIATLPLLIDNVYRPGPECITLYANASTVSDLRQYVFNDRIWPDVFRLSQNNSPFVQFEVIESGQLIQRNELLITGFSVEHTLPTLGFLIQDERAAIAVVADTGPCDAIWDFLNTIENLKAVFLEISFPNQMLWLAEVAKHLTPSLFLSETKKLRRPVQWYVTHMKPEFAKIIELEVAQLNISNCQYALSGTDYHF
jgi:cAMP phosphodiesterase